MIKYKYTIYNDVSCDQDFFIHEANEDGQYAVEWEEQVIGHLFVDGIDGDSGAPLWKGSTTSLNLIAAKLGDWIVSSDLLNK